MDTVTQASAYLNDLTGVLQKLDLQRFARMVDLFYQAWENGRRVFVMGNGGSAATASHLACDLNKGCCLDLERKFQVISLSDNVPGMMAIANDIAYDQVFVEPLKNFMAPGDLVMGISASGNSANVLAAIDHANANGAVTVGISGFSGGRLAQTARLCLVVPSDDMQKVEDAQTVVCHMLMQALYARLHDGRLPW